MKRLFAILLVVTSCLLAACATSSQARNVKPSGFLGDYRSLLQPGKPGEEELLVYRNPQADWAAYSKILLEPVTIWSDPNWKLSKDQLKDLQELVNSFGATLQHKLSADYEMVEQPGPGVMRVQVALTNGQQASTPLKVVSKGVPYGGAASFLWTFITGKPPFVGEASIEFMVKASATGDLLAAGADRRVGADTIVGTDSLNKEYFNSWGDVKYSLDYWSDDVVYRLCVLRGGTNCVKPKKGLKLPS
ncbi:MAG TPA: DUF3313 domain-containing protein [Thermoanaerobaculia bacterium]|nr:DUF3313 domain-containing protein [Thermoanaerobaculia bacterium]